MFHRGLRCTKSQGAVRLGSSAQRHPSCLATAHTHLCACSSSAVAVARSWLKCCLTFSVLCRRLVRASSGLSSTMSSVVLGLPSSEDSALL